MKETLTERKRTAIIQAAIEEFLEKGFKRSSMDALAVRAKVSKRTVYNHFANKELLFQEIITQLLQQSTAVAHIMYQSEQSLYSQLYVFAKNKLALLEQVQFRNCAKVVIAESIHSPLLTNKILQEMQEYEQKEGLEAWINAAINDGKLRSCQASYAAEQFIALLKAHTFWPQLLMNMPFPDEEQCQKIIEDSIGMFLNYYSLEEKGRA